MSPWWYSTKQQTGDRKDKFARWLCCWRLPFPGFHVISWYILGAISACAAERLSRLTVTRLAPVGLSLTILYPKPYHSGRKIRQIPHSPSGIVRYPQAGYGRISSQTHGIDSKYLPKLNWEFGQSIGCAEAFTNLEGRGGEHELWCCIIPPWISGLARILVTTLNSIALMGFWCLIMSEKFKNRINSGQYWTW
jgi:hypothetical protein